MQAYVEPEWMKAKEETVKDDSSANEENGESSKNNESDQDSQNEEDFYCIACDKAFKSDKAFKNHEKSKKHKENIELVKQHMKDEDVKLFFDKDDPNEVGNAENFEDNSKNR
jgi:DnaJ family protein A protein 5